MRSESEIQQLVQIEAAKHGIILMRNNSGALKDKTGRMIFFGLGNISKKHGENSKSSDLIGITSVTVTPEMVGRTLAVFTAIEVKEEAWKPSTTDKRERAQRNFIEWVKSRGGIAGFVNSVESFKRLLGM